MLKFKATLAAGHELSEYPGAQRAGTDALLLSGFARPKETDVCAELGAGAGIVPLLFSLHHAFRRFYAVERVPELAGLMRENLEKNGFSDRVTVLEGDARSLALPEKADLVLMNPPYLKCAGKAPADPLRRAARREEAGTVFELCRAAASWLKEKGSLCIVYRPERLADLFEAMRLAGAEPKELLPVADRPSLAPSLVLVRGVKGASPTLTLKKTFFLRDESGADSKGAKRLYEMGRLDDET